MTLPQGCHDIYTTATYTIRMECSLSLEDEVYVLQFSLAKLQVWCVLQDSA